MRLSRLSGVLSLAAIAIAYQPCPLLGPVFPAPTNLTSSSYLEAAFSALKESLDNATSTGVTQFGPWPASNNSFSIGVFDLKDQLFSYQYSSEQLQQTPKGQGVTQVTEDSIYRIGSLSKLITAYIFMIEAGPKYWNHYITEYIPQLTTLAGCSVDQDPINCIAWDQITLGALASHTAGVPRDYTLPAELLSPLLAGPEVAVAGGLPPLNQSEIPPCGLDLTDPTDGCSFQQFVAGFAKEAPVYLPSTNPIYSNAAYVLLAKATEVITGKSSPDMAASLFEKLNMTASSYYNPKTLDNAVVPLGVNSGYQAQTGIFTPVGGYFSNQLDLARFGQSLLSSSILTTLQTRQWMKPVAFVEATTQAFGYTWEIFRQPHVVGDHHFDLYTKTGDVFDYSSHLLLSPDYGVGFIILAAGNDTSIVRTILADAVTNVIFPALEKEARQQAQSSYAGTYRSGNDEIVLSTQHGKPGLKIEKFVMNGTDELATFWQGEDLRMYPSNLQQTSSGSTQIGWRAAHEMPAIPAGSFNPRCQQWGTVGNPIYGSVAIDNFVFDVENSKATTISPKAWRTTLNRVS